MSCTSDGRGAPGQRLVDYHVHPDYSVDARGTVAEHCRTALQRGLGEICFTTHFDADPEYADQEGWVRLRGRLTPLTGRWLGAYHADIAQAREEFGPTGLVVRAGLEVDYFRGVERALIPLLEGAGASDWLEAYGADEGVGRYCAAIAEAAGCGLFDCLGHLEVYRRSRRARGSMPGLLPPQQPVSASTTRSTAGRRPPG